MQKRFLGLILAYCFSGINFASEQQQEVLKKTKQTDPIRQVLIEFAAQERAKEKEEKLRIKKQREERLSAYIAARKFCLQSQLKLDGNRISSRRNPTDEQLSKREEAIKQMTEDKDN